MALTKAERREMNQYKYRFSYKGKRTSKKAMVEKYGKDGLERRMLEAARTFFEDPWQDNYWMDGLRIDVYYN